MKRHRRQPPKPRVSSSVLEHLNPHAAGIDCGSAEHFVAVPADRDPTPIRSFPTFTSDLQRLADWLTACRVTPVAMDATGVYWIPVFEILEARGFTVAHRSRQRAAARSRTRMNPASRSAPRCTT